MAFTLNNTQLPNKLKVKKYLPCFRQKNIPLISSFTAIPILRYLDITRPDDIANVPLFMVLRYGYWSKLNTNLDRTIVESITIDGASNVAIPSAERQYVTNFATITYLSSTPNYTVTWQSSINSALLTPQVDRTFIADSFPSDAVPIRAESGGITFDGSSAFMVNRFTILPDGTGILGTNRLIFGTPVNATIEQSYNATALGEYIVFKVAQFEIIYYVEFRGEIYLPVADLNEPKMFEFYHDTLNNLVIIFTRLDASTGLLFIRDDALANRVIGVLTYDRPFVQQE